MFQPQGSEIAPPEENKTSDEPLDETKGVVRSTISNS